MKSAEEPPSRPAPTQSDQALQQAVQNHGAGRLAEAETLYRQVLAAAPRHPVALHLLGVAAFQLGRRDEAVEAIGQALAVKPDYAEAHYNLGNVLRELGRLRDAAESYRRAVALQPEYLDAQANLAAALLLLGAYSEAVTTCRAALALQPCHGVVLNILGTAFLNLGQIDEAVSAYREAAALQKDSAEAQCNFGAALQKRGDLDEALACYKRALELKPDYVKAHANLTWVYEKTNRTEDLRAAVAEAKRHAAGNLSIAVREAWLLKRDKDLVGARAVLEQAAGEGPGDPMLGPRAYTLGDLFDRLDDTAAAIAYCAEGNRLARAAVEIEDADPARALEMIDKLEASFTPGCMDRWRHRVGDDGRPDPVFLVGFPRSGTTLLDTVLLSHPGIAVVEEKPTTWTVRQKLKGMGKDYPGDLAGLSMEELTTLRDAYFSELDCHLDAEQREHIVVDKMPLDMLQAGLIHRILPRARFIFALRHPCDCVLSCFMRAFALNDFMANFLDLGAAAHFYDRSMSLWTRYRDLLPLSMHTLRYEDLLADFRGNLEPLLGFMGLGWDDALHGYAETALRRQRISTPSYNQVTEPLYTQARYRWQRYRPQMEPVLPILLPWARRFGYEE